MAFLDLFSRTVPSGGTLENIRAVSCRDVVEGSGNFSGNVRAADKAEQFAMYGGQLQWLKIANQTTSAATYPDKGGGTVAANASSGGTTLQLHSTVLQTQTASVTPIGMLVVLTSGNAAGDVRRITGWTSGTQTVDVNRAWTSGRVPASGDSYELLIDARWLNGIYLKTEFANSSAQHTGRLVLWDWPLTSAPTEAYRSGSVIGTLDSEQTVYNTTLSGATVETSYYHGEIVSVDSRGVLGAQFRITTAPAAAASLWMAAR